MSGHTAASDQNTALVNEWYAHMRAQDIEKSSELKQQVDKQLEQIEHDYNLTILYTLFRFRHTILERNFDAAKSQLEKFKPFLNDMDHLHSYYYYFFKGLYAYGEKRYDEAVKNYQIAEKLLGSIEPEPLERAEFHYKIGSVYFHLDYMNLAIDHAQQALDIFESQGNFQTRCVACKVLLGQSYKDLHMFEHALFYYEEALYKCEELEEHTIKNIIYENLGELYSQQNQLDTAIEYFKLSLKDNDRVDYQISTLYVLSKECFKAKKNIEAKHWLDEGLERALNTNNREYVYHFKLLKALYLDSLNLKDTFIEGIEFFKLEGLWDFVEEYAYKLAEKYFQCGEYKSSAVYYKLILQAQKITSIKGGSYK